MRSLFVLRFLWTHIKPYRWYYVGMLIAPTLGSFYYIFYNYSTKLLLDVASSSGALSYRDFLPAIAWLVWAELQQNAVWRLSNLLQWKSEPYVRASILSATYDYVQNHSYVFFQKNFPGNITSKVKGILNGYDHFWSELHHGIFYRACAAFVNLCAVFFVSVYIGLGLLGWAIAFIIFVVYFSKRLNHLAFLETEERHSLMGRVADCISNILVVISFVRKKYELQALEAQMNDRFVKRQIELNKYDSKFHFIMGLLYLMMVLGVLLFVIHLRVIGVISAGGIAFVMSTVLVFGDEIYRMTMELQKFFRSWGDLKSSISILAQPWEQTDITDAKPITLKDNSIELRNVTFAYEDDPIFKKFSLHIRAGEKIGIVGSSGVGKSTIVHLLLRYFSPQSGVVFVGGEDIARVMADSVRESIAVIPQETMLFHRTVIDNIRYGKVDATDEEVIVASQKAHLHHFIQQLPEGYQTEVGDRGTRLSGGQRQRVSIARAILKDAPILILDEATAALDSKTEKDIEKSLTALIKDKKKTVIAIAHRLSTLKNMDRIIVLDKGRIIEEGAHAELLNKPDGVYRNMWNS